MKDVKREFVRLAVYNLFWEGRTAVLYEDGVRLLASNDSWQGWPSDVVCKLPLSRDYWLGGPWFSLDAAEAEAQLEDPEFREALIDNLVLEM